MILPETILAAKRLDFRLANQDRAVFLRWIELAKLDGHHADVAKWQTELEMIQRLKRVGLAGSLYRNGLIDVPMDYRTPENIELLDGMIAQIDAHCVMA